MRILIAILKGTLTLAIFIFVAISVDNGFEEIVVGGLGLIYTTISLELSFVKNQITDSHLGVLRGIVAAVRNIKDDYVKEEADGAMHELNHIENEVGKESMAKYIGAIFGLIIITLSLGLILKGSMA